MDEQANGWWCVEESLMTYSKMVTQLAKSPYDVLATLEAAKINPLHGALGIATEAGELLDTIKKHVFYDQPLDRENVIEELGDLEFYMELMRQAISVSREATLAANMNKLTKRYPNLEYTDKRAEERADKQ